MNTFPVTSQISDNLIPMVVEPTERGERSYDLFSRLMKSRIIMLSGAVHDVASSILTSQLLYLDSEDSSKPIQFYINSPGGVISAGYAIHDVMKYIKSPVHTICMGIAASMGSFLLAAGDQRFSLPNSRIMIHQPLGGVSGQASDIEIEAREIVKIKDKLTKDLAGYCGKADQVEKVKQEMDRNYWMTSQEAQNYGIIDSIL